MLYVPSGWWHLVVNLEESVALTQNFVSPAELAIVLDFMKNKSDQLSGFKRSQFETDTPAVSLAPGRQAASIGTTAAIAQSNAIKPSEEEGDECDGAGFNVFELFCDRLGRFDQQLLEESMKQVEGMEETRRATCALIRRNAPVQPKRKANSGPSWWDKLKSTSTIAGEDSTTTTAEGAPAEQGAGFSFGDHLDSSELELEEVPW